MLHDPAEVFQCILRLFAEISPSTERFETQQSSSGSRIARWGRRILQGFTASNERAQNFSARSFRVEEASACSVVKTRDHRIANFYRSVVIAHFTGCLPRIQACVR